MQDTTTEAELALRMEAWRNARVKRVDSIIRSALTENNCDLVAVPQIVDGKVIALIQIVAK